MPNPLLTEMYGTRTDEAADAAEMFVKIAEAQGYDLEGMTDEEVLGTFMKVAQEAAADEAVEEAAQDLAEAIKDKVEEEVEAPAAPPSEEMKAAMAYWDEDFQEKVAEADFLGRVSAHAFVDEMDDLEKEAQRGNPVERPGKYPMEAALKARREQIGAAERAGTLYPRGTKAPKVRKHTAPPPRGGRVFGFKPGTKAYAREYLRRVKGLASKAKKPYVWGPAAGLGALGLAGAGYAAGRRKKKAAEIIRDYLNYVDDDFEKEAEYDWNDAVENRAAEILGEWGIY